MRRHLMLLRLFLSTSIAASMEYRLNFLTSALTSAIGFFGNMFSLFLFYGRGYHFEGWRWEEALVVMGLFTLMNGLSSTFLTPNLSRIVRHVERGTLDFVLLKPVDSQFWVSTRMASPWGVPDIVFGASIIAYASIQLHLSPGAILVALPSLIFAIASLYALWFMLAATSIWFVKIYNVTEVLKGLLEAGRFPIVAFPPIYRFFFTFIVPVAFLTTIPAEALLHRASASWLLGSGGVALFLLLAARALWRFALRFYTSASS